LSATFPYCQAEISTLLLINIFDAITMNFLKKDLLPIETKRLVLRLLEPEEAHLMVQYVIDNRTHLQPWEPVRPEGFFKEELWVRELKSRQVQFYKGEGLRLVIFSKQAANGPVIGVINFTDIIRGVFQACFLGYSIHHKFEGMGIMYEALNAAIEYMFDTFKLHRIMANYIPRNERSGNVLKKLGFQVEGYARDYLKVNGKWEDHILTAKIRDMK
jgi:ribosomal-protein-alanine N-acetyltransferase